MKIEIKYRDGAARYGFIEINGKRVEIPNVIFVSTHLSHPPKNADIIGRLKLNDEKTIHLQPPGEVFKNSEVDVLMPSAFSYPASMPSNFHRISESNWCVVSGNEEGYIPIKKTKEESKKKSKIFTLANAASISPKSRIFLRNVIQLREKAGYNSLLHLPAVATPSNLSLLVYLGIDIVDSVSTILAARQGYYLFPEGRYWREENPEFCSCPACREINDPFERILQHNYNMLIQEMKRVRFAIKRGTLRELVEKRILSSPELVEKFRILHSDYYHFLEERTPITKNSPLLATTRDSIQYPEIVRFRERVIERYRKPKNTRVLLLLPCSAKKPYSSSKSHKIFRRAISSTSNPWVVHEIIVTSPLGIVPRELENVYPASRYDIPVTGTWYEEEKDMIREMLRNFLKINSYDLVISHLPKDLDEIVEDVLPDRISTNQDHPTSQKSIDELYKTLERYVCNYKKINGIERLKETLRGIASYQFGQEISRYIIPDSSIIEGRYPSLRVIKEGKQIASISKNRGLFSLTIEGGKILFSKRRNLVMVDEGVDIKGSVLAVGIEDSDPEIRIGDEVVIIRKNKLYGVGIAKMNGREMVESEWGEAVRVRHHL